MRASRELAETPPKIGGRRGNPKLDEQEVFSPVELLLTIAGAVYLTSGLFRLVDLIEGKTPRR